MPTESQKTALKNGVITKKQYDKLPSHFLDAIIRSKSGKKTTKKKRVKKK